MRLAAVERFAAAPLPTPSEEIWRYSRIDRLDLDAFAPAASVTEVEAPRLAASLIVDAEPELFADETPDVFAELNRAFMSPVVIRGSGVALTGNAGTALSLSSGGAGAGMLVNQGAIAFRLWTGVEPGREVMRAVLAGD